MKTSQENAAIPDPEEALKNRQLNSPEQFINALAEGLVIHNQDGEIILINEAATTISGLSKEQMMDREFLKTSWHAIKEDGSPFPFEKFPAATAQATGQPQKDIVLGISKPDGSITWMNVNAFPIIDPETKKISITVTSFSDITSNILAKQELKKQEEKWRSVLNTSKSGVFLIDSDYFITLANEYGKKMLHMMGDFAEINEATYFLDKLPVARREPVKKILDAVMVGERVEYEILYHKENGEDLWLFVSYSPVRDDKENISSICITANNITMLKKKEAALLKSEQRWKFALEGAGDGVWEYNFQTKESYYSPLYKTMLGYTEEEFADDVLEWKNRLHPDDRYKITEIDTLYEQGAIEHHSTEYRIQTKSGAYAWVLDRGMLLERTPDGRPLKLIGTHKNMTERKAAEEAVIQSEQRFSSFMANTPTMTWIIDEHAVFRYLNEPYMKAFDLSEEDIGRSIYDIFPPHICKGFVENNWKVWTEERSIETVEEGVGPSGEQQFYHIFKFPLKPENGTRLLGGVALDITNKIQIEQQLTADKEKKKREIIQAIINAQEKERKELAYELHDNVNQVLTSSKLMLEVAAEKPELSGEFVKRSLAYLNEAIIEIRKISHSLNPGTLQDISLEAAIGEVIQTINSTGKLKIIYNYTTVGIKKEIQPEIQLSALRIVQEQLNNTLKHAQATEATVSLELSTAKLTLSIQDNGTGFIPDEVKRGLGLNNIFNRVAYYHGLIHLDSSPGNGCSLFIEIPLT